MVTDFFDGAYCINLERRSDKWAECLKEFSKHDLLVYRFNAVDGSTLSGEFDIKDTIGRARNHAKGIMVCALSHKGVISLAKKYMMDSVLILEDDVCFDNKLNEKFSEWIKEVPDNWDMLYFGGNHNVREIENKISPHVFKATNTQTTHAYAVKETVYDMILNRLGNINYDVDVIYTEIQKQCNAYCFTPRLAWQRAGVSDIFNTHVDYSFLKDHDGCHIK